MYDRKLETVAGAKAKHDANMKAAARARLDKVAAQVKAKKKARKEAQA